MAFRNPDDWRILGLEDDLLGNRQIARGRPIGGGETADEQDEAEVVSDNGIQGWTAAGRAVITQLTTYGQEAPQAPIFTTSTASGGAYEVIGEAIATLGPGRGVVTVYVDIEDMDIQVEVLDSGGSVLDTDAISSPGRLQDILNLDAGNETDVRFRISVKREDVTDGSIYSLRVLEDKSPLDTFTSSDPVFEFKKLDDSAYAGEKALHAPFLDRVASNVEATHHGRLRRCGTWWPVSSTTGGGEQVRPMLAAHTTVGYVLTDWTVSPGCRTLVLRLLVETFDATVYFGLAVLDLFSGRLSTRRADSGINPVGSPDALELEADVSGMQGGQAALVLLVRSNDSGASTSQVFSAGTHVIEDVSKVGGLTGITFTSGKRWKLEFDENPASSYDPEGHQRPSARTVLWEASDDAWVWPNYLEAHTAARRPDWAENGSYSVRVTEIGRANILSMAIVESTAISRTSMAAALRPGMPPGASRIRGLYMRQREQWTRRTRVHHALWGYDPAQTSTGAPGPTTPFGVVRHLPLDWEDFGACMVGIYDAAEDKAAAQLVRTTLRLQGLLILAGLSGANIEVLMRAAIASWGGTAWDGDVSTSAEVPVEIGPLLPKLGGAVRDDGQPFSATADLVFGQIGALRNAYHNLRGAHSLAELASRRHGLVPFGFTIEDDGWSSGGFRLVRLQIKARDVDGPLAFDVDGNPHAPALTALQVAGWSVLTREGVS